ncbi:MAG TPA: hypothetical protein VGG03_05605 [Thermoanaerobaculia bacterium]|jgi:hypothetical protein
MVSNSHQYLVAVWQDLIAAAQEHERELPDLTNFKMALEQALEDVIATKARQVNLESRRRQATQDYNDKVAEGRELVRRLKNLVKAAFPRTDPRLADFGLKPGRPNRKLPEIRRQDGSPGYH